jgi:hypothetical protein
VANTAPTRWVFELPAQLIIATTGAIFLGTIAGFIPAILFAAVTKNNSGGNFGDHVVDQRAFAILSDNPYFLGAILVAFVLGYTSHRFFKSSAATCVWILPSIILIWNVFTWKSYAPRSDLADAWANYFGKDCGGSECIYELFVTAPFYTSVAYSLGWLVKHVFLKRAAGSAGPGADDMTPGA